jgi:glutamate N-acetyltransferase/amino-acid N-acetyltransferase
MGGQPDKSPLAPATFPDMNPVAGVSLASAATGMKYQGRDDVLLVALADGTSVAGTLTKSKTSSAPVDWCRRHLPVGEASGLIVNAGNANAFTGAAGIEAVEKCVEAVADQLACRPSRIFAASTGVIGEPLPYDMIVDALPQTASALAPSNSVNWEQAAAAIMTTDTFAKGATASAKIGDVEVSISGIAKGSGMIAPDMATMLSFIFTDAKIPADVLGEITTKGVDTSYNAITVDSDTSTSDTVLVFATGAAEGQGDITSADDPALEDFVAKLNEVMTDLAHQIVRDGEGASKFIAVTVTGAENDKAAKIIGLAIANSPLVKTAIAGEDANWGRIVMAIGKSGEAADRDKLSIQIGGVDVARDGAVVEGYDEAPVAAHVKNQDVSIATDVGVGDGEATVWTCDLTHGYISINADYRS